MAVNKNMEAQLLENGADKDGLASNPVMEKGGALEIVTGPTLGQLAPLIREGLRAARDQLIPVGTWLRQIRDLELWFPRYDSFAACCRDEFGIGKSRAYQVIEAERVMSELPEKSTIVELNEGQLRELAKVPSEKRLEVLEKARAAAEAVCARLTAKILRQIALEVCPELKPKAVKRARRTIKINDGWATFEELWAAWTAAKSDVQAKLMYHLKDHCSFPKIFKGMERKLALVEANKAGKPFRRGPKSILN